MTGLPPHCVRYSCMYHMDPSTHMPSTFYGYSVHTAWSVGHRDTATCDGQERSRERSPFTTKPIHSLSPGGRHCRNCRTTESDHCIGPLSTRFRFWPLRLRRSRTFFRLTTPQTTPRASPPLCRRKLSGRRSKEPLSATSSSHGFTFAKHRKANISYSCTASPLDLCK